MQLSNIYSPKQKDVKKENSRELKGICKMIAYNCREGIIVLAVNSKQTKKRMTPALKKEVRIPRNGYFRRWGRRKRIIDSYL